MSSQKPAGAQIKRATHLRPLQSAVVDDKAITNVALLHYFLFLFFGFVLCFFVVAVGVVAGDSVGVAKSQKGYMWH